MTAHTLSPALRPPLPPSLGTRAAAGFRRFLPQLLPLLATLSAASATPAIIQITRDVILDFSPQPNADPGVAEDAVLSAQLFALGARVIDSTLAPLLRPDLAPPPGPSPSARPPARGSRAISDDPHLFESALRLGNVLLSSFPLTSLRCRDTTALPPVGPVATPLVCGMPTPALVTACLACLAQWDRHVVGAACAFLRTFLAMSTESPRISSAQLAALAREAAAAKSATAAHDDINADPRAVEAAAAAARRAAAAAAAAPMSTQDAQQAAIQAETALAWDEQQRRSVEVVKTLSSAAAVAPGVAGVAGSAALLLPGHASQPLAERLYKRLAVCALKEFPRDAVAPKESASLMGGVLAQLQRIFRNGGQPSKWLGEVLADPSVLRPGLVAPSRLAELAGAVLDSRLSASQFSCALADLADAVRGRDSGRPVVGSQQAPPGGAAADASGGATRDGGAATRSAAEDDDDELD